MRKSVVIGIVLGGLVLAAVGGWIAGSRIQSPAEAAARTAAPEPSPILVPVEMKELSTAVITRGTGRFGSPVSISLAPSGLKSLPQVLTAASPIGSELEDGAVMAEIAGRPVFVFAGSTPSYRDLGIGMSGRDVMQLEQALDRIGLDPGDVDGLFDSATGGAMEVLYATAGFEPFYATAEQLAELKPVESDLVAGGAAEPGIQLPADEFVFVPSSQVRVAEYLVDMGQIVDGPFAQVSDATVAVDASVPIESAGLIKAGMAVIIDEPDLGINATGMISRVAPGPGTDGVDGFHVYFEVVADEAPAALVNASVRITVPIESTNEPVLAVPISALLLTAEGDTDVQVMRDGTIEHVAVEPGLSANGFVGVTIVRGELYVGDMVVVGFDLPAS